MVDSAKISLFRRSAHQDALALKRRRVAHFSYRDLIGSGGMADVYMEPVMDGKCVAVKVPKSSLWKEPFQSPTESVLFRETRLLAKLIHPNIVSLLARWQADNVWRFAMECCPYSVAALLDKMDLPRSFAFYVFREVGKALQHAHAKDIAHADIKPENILIQEGLEEGLVPSVKLCDFGIAEERNDPSEAGFAKGTPGYMSPEVIAGLSRSNPKADMFSLGCALYEMLGGELDFRSDTTGDLWNAALDNRLALTTADDPDPAVNQLLSELGSPDGSKEDGTDLMCYLNAHMPWVINQIPSAGESLDLLQPGQHGAILCAGGSMLRPDSLISTLVV